MLYIKAQLYPAYEYLEQINIPVYYFRHIEDFDNLQI